MADKKDTPKTEISDVAHELCRTPFAEPQGRSEALKKFLQDPGENGWAERRRYPTMSGRNNL
jgi:hypothetical protein